VVPFQRINEIKSFTKAITIQQRANRSYIEEETAQNRSTSTEEG